MGMSHTHYLSYGGVVCALRTLRPSACPASQRKRTRATRRMPKATQPSHVRGPGDHRRPTKQAPAMRTARVAPEKVRPSTRPQRRAAYKLNRVRVADALAARSQRHLRAKLRKEKVRSFRRSIGVLVAWKGSLATGRKGGCGSRALRSSSSPSRHLELLVACLSRLRAHLDATPCRL